MTQKDASLNQKHTIHDILSLVHKLSFGTLHHQNIIELSSGKCEQVHCYFTLFKVCRSELSRFEKSRIQVRILKFEEEAFQLARSFLEYIVT